MKDEDHLPETNFQQSCHMCGHELSQGMDTCPECDAPVVDLQALLKSALGDERPTVKKQRNKRNKSAIVNWLDEFSLHIVGTLLLGSIGIVYRLLSVANEEWWKIPEISNWLTAYTLIIFAAWGVLFRIGVKLSRIHREESKE